MALGLALVLLACAGCTRGGHRAAGSGSAVQSAACPSPGTRVPFLQLANDTASFAGCVVDTEVAFAGPAALGSFRPWLEEQGVLRPGDIAFAVAPPNQADATGVNNWTSYNMAIPRDAAAPFYEARSGTVFKVHGQVRLAYYGSGIPMWTFSVDAFEPPPAAWAVSTAAPLPSGS